MIFVSLFDLHLLVMLSKYKYHIWLHITVLIFGLTGVLGKLITTGSCLLVWYRVGIALVCILAYFIFTKFLDIHDRDRDHRDRDRERTLEF